jgi:ankyrin repeat protein
VRSFGKSQVNYLHGSKKKIQNPPHHDFVDLDERLHRSASKGDARELNFLLEMGAEVNKANKEGETPLWIAAQERHQDIVRELLKAGADRNKPKIDGRTPLWIAA